jgi:hypothetical protein
MMDLYTLSVCVHFKTQPESRAVSKLLDLCYELDVFIHGSPMTEMLLNKCAMRA